MVAIAMDNKVSVLLVEDSPGDARLILEAFKESKINTEVKVVEDGVEAIAFLRQQGSYANEQRPDLILLDLNLPRKDGREVLLEIKNDDALKQIPVLVLTTSNQAQDIITSYERHANSFITKPIDMDTFFETMKSLEDFWFHVVKLPPHDDPDESTDKK
jgi:two-component system, chemotaxis family, response regulator Rcp1